MDYSSLNGRIASKRLKQRGRAFRIQETVSLEWMRASGFCQGNAYVRRLHKSKSKDSKRGRPIPALGRDRDEFELRNGHGD